MTKDVLITIVGKQKYDADNDKVEMTTVGTIEEDDLCYTIKYNEEQEPPRNPIKATLTIQKDANTVQMAKSGAYSSLLIVERSKRNLCNYGTEFGDILMGIYGREIDVDCRDDEGRILFSYDIDINGALTSQNEVTVTYKINR